MSKVSTLRVVSKDRAPQLPDRADTAAREGLLAMSVATGLKVMHAMMQAEITGLAGPKGKHNPDRDAVRHGSAPSSVTLGARRVPVSRPRARTGDGEEVALGTFAAFAGDDLLAEVVLERMLAGLACRRFTTAQEPVGARVEADARSTSRSRASRRIRSAHATPGSASTTSPRQTWIMSRWSPMMRCKRSAFSRSVPPPGIAPSWMPRMPSV